MSGLDVVVATDVAVNADMYSERQRMHAVVLFFFELESKSFFLTGVEEFLGVSVLTSTRSRMQDASALPRRHRRVCSAALSGARRGLTTGRSPIHSLEDWALS
jgi:hypothetical protein